MKVMLNLTVPEARALLDATAACMDDTGSVSRRWFSKYRSRKAAERAIAKLRDTWAAADRHPTKDL